MNDRARTRAEGGSEIDSPTGAGIGGRPGYTLAELAVVLLMVGLILSLVLPNVSGVTQGERLNDTARRLAGLALETHSEAATKSRPWFLCLDLDRQRVWLATVRPDREGDSGRESKFFEMPRGVTIMDLVHPTGGLIREGRAAFGYWPQGGSEPGEIHLTNESGEQLTLFLRPFLGRAEIKVGYLREETK
jgi:type II secretory pathway pseudopilin PulG